MKWQGDHKLIIGEKQNGKTQVKFIVQPGESIPQEALDEINSDEPTKVIFMDDGYEHGVIGEDISHVK